MNLLKNLWVKISDAFNRLPSPVKAIFYVLLNSLTLLLVADLQAIQGNYNQYIQAFIVAAINLLAYLSLHFGARAKSLK